MNRLPYQAVIVDFDRTLLHTDKTISDYTIRVLQAWQETGARLFAATARPERAIGDYCRQIAFDAVCTLNGARTVTKDSVIENPIAEESAVAILEQLSGIPGIVLSVEAENGIYANVDIPPWAPKVTDRLLDLPRKEKIYKILASHPDIPADRLAGSLPEDEWEYPVLTESQILEAAKEAGEEQAGAVYSMTEDRKLETGYYMTRDLPEVRDQGPYGTCWAHAAVGAMEIDLIKDGRAGTDIDLSEYCKKSEILPRLQQLEALSHTHRNKAILDSTSAIYTTEKDEKLASLKNYDVFVPATEEEDGVDGLVPAPSASETNKFLRSDGTWVDVEGGTYVLPPATDTTLGGIIVGDGLEITEEGVLSGNEYHAGNAISMSGDDDIIDVNVGQGLSVDNDNNIVNDGVLDVSEKQSAPGVFTVSKRTEKSTKRQAAKIEAIITRLATVRIIRCVRKVARGKLMLIL